ncbi:MAG TPA: NTP transferase domain-containing protein [Tepidisphaeraceae bacterium]|jgi:molybdopterin-guanine dinucleotide biosynthesis protein A
MHDAELILLAGGSSSRMGTDKLRLRDASGRLLVERWFERLNWLLPPRLVLTPGATPPTELAAWPVLHDAMSGEGPLRGVATALAATATTWLVVVAVDTPGIGGPQIDWLLGRRPADPSARLWMTRRPSGIEPFPLLIHRDMTGPVAARLHAARRSLHDLADERLARVADAPADWPPAVWQNLNRPEDLTAYLSPG